MLSKASHSPETLHDRLLAALDRLIKRRYGSFKRAEESTGVRRITLRQWRRGSRRPSLHRILQTFEQLGFTLLEVIQEADLYPELHRDPSLQLAAVLRRHEPRDPVLVETLSQSSWHRPPSPIWCEIPPTLIELERHLDQDQRIAQVEFQEYLSSAVSQQDRAAALCLWGRLLNMRGANIDAGLAVRAALDRAAPGCPLYYLLLSVSASVAKNFRAYPLARSHAEQSILGFLRTGDTDNATRGLLTLGIIHWALEELDESERAYRDAVRLNPTSRFASMCHFNLIYNFLSTGRVDAALKSIEDNQQSFAAIPPAYAFKMHWLSAKVLVASDRPKAAVEELKAALHSPRMLSENPQVVFQVFFELAELLATAGRGDELASYERRLMPILALCDDSEDSVAIARAFLRFIRAGSITEGDVRGFSERFDAACTRSSGK